MKFIVTVVSIILLTGCASIKITPPTENDYTSNKTYDKPFEKTWIRAVDWFAEHNVIIEKIEKSSGLLTAKHKLESNDSYLDCGDINASGLLAKPKIYKYGMLNLTVREIDSNRSKVNVNFFGEFSLEGNDAWDGRLVQARGNCVSTGEVERSVLAYIGENQ